MYISGMNKLSRDERTRVVAALVEGNSIRATVRMTGVAKNTVVKLLADLGSACAEHHDRAVRGLRCRRVQCDEIWSFVYAKQKNVPEHKRGEAGDVWTWTALDPDSKLIASYAVGQRDAETAYVFMQDLADRLATRIQLTTDGNRAYLDAVDSAFGTGIDFGMLIKLYGHTPDETRYSPADCIGTRKKHITGAPNPRHISTSYVERQNLTMRMCMRRFTRLTNAFSKKAENLIHAVALHFAFYNFCRVHQTLRVTPAMEAGIADHVWTLDELVGLLEARESVQRRSA